jgi:hypothetical protein
MKERALDRVSIISCSPKDRNRRNFWNLAVLMNSDDK